MCDTRNSRYHHRRRWRWLILVLLAPIGAIASVYFFLDQPRPVGKPGPQAEKLASRLLTAVDADAWKSTGAVRWTFADRHRHLWDRERHLARVRWDDLEVLVDLNRRTGLAWRGGTPLPPAEVDEKVDAAWNHWINDAFWLNPVVKILDPGTVRQLVPLSGGDSGLLVTYSSGGATPGDSYLWLVGPDGLPRAWKMWVSILPVGGIEASWEGWTTLATGARVATRHRIFFLTLELTDVAGAATLAQLEPGADPFAPLFEDTADD